MAVSDYDLVPADIYPLLPFDTSTIDANSRVSTTDLTGYIEDGASLVTGALDKAGLSPTSLTDDAKRHAQKAVKHYAAAQAMLHLGFSGKPYDEHMRLYTQEVEVLRTRPQVMADKGAFTASNIDTTTYNSARSKRVYTRDYEW